MHKFFCTLVLVLTCFGALAQDYTLKGKIVYNDKTLTGFIKTQGSEQTPQKFSFSESQTGPFVQVPDNVVRIEFDNGDVFQPAFVSISIVNVGYLQRSRASYEAEKFGGIKFLQQLLSGSYPLYVYTDFYGYPHFFYKSPGDTAVTYLRNHPYVDEKSNYVTDIAFNNQIGFLTQKNNCKIAEADINRLEYELSSMRKIFSRLNTCVGSDVKDSYTLQNKTKLLPGVMAGLSFEHVEPPGVETNSWDQPPGIVLGANVFFSSGGNKKGYGFGLDLFYTSIKREGDSMQFFNRPGISSVRISNSFITLRPYFKLDIGGEKLRPYMTVGFFNLAYNISHKEEHKNQAGVTISDINVRTQGGIGISPFIGGGLSYKNLSLEASYEGLIFKKDLRRLQIAARYSLFK
jgi:hypothetical protein